MAFIIKNVSESTVGPYNGVSINAGDTYSVPDPVHVFSTNPLLHSDCLSQKILIIYGSLEDSGYSAAQLLFQFSLSAYIGRIGYAGPSFSVQNGLVYNSTLPATTSGNIQGLQGNQFAELAIQYRNKFLNIVGNATTTIKSGSGRLHSFTINDNTTNGTITIYDNTAASGTKIGTFQIGSPSGGLLSSSGQQGPIIIGPLGCEFSTGLTVVTSGSSNNNITVLYQ